jgi:hypothetical protein
MRLTRTSRSGATPNQGRYLLASAVVLALAVAPFAVAAGEGNPVRLGVRNPGGTGALSATSETQIIASNATYGTRQSNKGEGGGAIYGCRSAPGSEPCLRATNLTSGRAFEFATRGVEGGFISATAPGARPFATDATGVATGLNADRVDGLNGADLQARFAKVNAAGTLVAGRGVTSATSNGGGTYTLVFAQDVTGCALTATQTTVDDAGAVAVEGIDPRTVRVRTRRGGGPDGAGPSDPAPRPFDLVVTC